MYHFSIPIALPKVEDLSHRLIKCLPDERAFAEMRWVQGGSWVFEGCVPDSGVIAKIKQEFGGAVEVSNAPIVTTLDPTASGPRPVSARASQHQAPPTRDSTPAHLRATRKERPEPVVFRSFSMKRELEEMEIVPPRWLKEISKLHPEKGTWTQLPWGRYSVKRSPALSDEPYLLKKASLTGPPICTRHPDLKSAIAQCLKEEQS